MLHSLVFLILLILTNVHSSQAADISLSVTAKSLPDKVLIEVRNLSSYDVVVESVEIELDQKKYSQTARNAIKASETKDFIFSVQPPRLSGSYILPTIVRYMNDGVLLSVRHVGLYHLRGQSLLSESCRLEVADSDGTGRILLTASQAHRWRIVVPEEIETQTISTKDNVTTYTVTHKAKDFTASNQIFAVAEERTGNIHQASFCGAILTTGPDISVPLKGRLPGYLFILLGTLFFVLSSAIIFMGKQGRLSHMALRYGCRMFFLALSCFVLKEMDQWLMTTLRYVPWAPYQWIARVILDTINGGNYRYFFQYFVDGYFALCFVFVLPCLYWFDGRRPPSGDKYVASFAALLTLPQRLVRRGPGPWGNLAKLGFLTIMVKFFFTPMMVSWAIGSVYNMAHGFRSFQWNVFAINAYLVQLLILVDTVVFSLGYLTESKYLKNEIKSVDPTFFGWLVCLWCYPPFNTFSFKPLDFYIIRINLPYPAWVGVVALCAITCLWGIFVWASVALGFKASNLTNRGIVSAGPYRYVRHPAYAAKLMIWVIQAIFFAQFGIFILLGFIIIYVLRAWTEERHLSRDPNYLAYRQSVRRWFIPGII